MSSANGLTLARINAITVQINSSQDLHELLTVIMDTARELLSSEAASLLLYDPTTEELIFDVARGDKGRLLATKRIALGQGIAGICAQDRQPVLVNDAPSDPRIFKGMDQELEFQTRNLLAVPMLARSRMIGVLEVLNTTDGRDYTNQDLRLLTYLSNMAALAILNRQLFDDVSERMEELNCIYTIGGSIRDSLTVHELLESALRAIEDVLGVGRLSVFLRNFESEAIEIKAVRGFTIDDSAQIINPSEGITGLVLRSGDPLLVRDLERDLRINRVQIGRYKTS
ncbi:MAG: GAF domain-containing protein, partial [Leptospiraceae bacterium]|nr:GAF domain-containing protein [Leptospiraceae bacterium]